ncbi:transcription termination factor MTERF8, chloroplastic-like [Diospyros lotus]|uniref:transcription termination factor MTERF8, chloroplastic-like n=1 Tax=Diospyros lotus TaxID=55363 RepID=UPI00224D131B|nr:transcription termination factor MTERF8, chloroplastic-like [Diospyros lotus]
MSICKILGQVVVVVVRVEVRVASSSPITHRRFSSSSIQVEEASQNQVSFSANYLVNTCGFDPEKAISASKYVKFQAPVKPDSVLAFLKNHGFTKTQITRCITRRPVVLSSNLDKTLLPKVEFLKSKGIPTTDIAEILSRTPAMLTRSLENQILPSFSFLSSFLESEEKAIAAIKRWGDIVLCDLETCLQPNIEILQHAGVPAKNIVTVLQYQPRAFISGTNRFQQVVEEVKKMGFNPARVNFMLAIVALRTMSKSTWNKKIQVYKTWGWSDNEILLAFRKHPYCLVASEYKIMRVMNFFVNKVGYEPSVIAKIPILTSFSLERRIFPRYAVYEVLVSKGLVTDQDFRLTTALQISEKSFLDRFLKPHERQAPELLKLYKKKHCLAKAHPL